MQRLRTAKGWVVVSLILLSAGLVFGCIFFWATPAGQPVNWPEVIGMGALAIAVVWGYIDGMNARREAILFDDSITVYGIGSGNSSPTTYKLSEIQGAAILHPNETGWHEPALILLHKGEEEVIGIESKAGLKRLAQTIHDAGVSVYLRDWEPDQENAFEKAFSWQAGPVQVVAKAHMETLPPLGR